MWINIAKFEVECGDRVENEKKQKKNENKKRIYEKHCYGNGNVFYCVLCFN